MVQVEIVVAQVQLHVTPFLSRSDRGELTLSNVEMLTTAEEGIAQLNIVATEVIAFARNRYMRTNPFRLQLQTIPVCSSLCSIQPVVVNVWNHVCIDVLLTVDAR